MNTKHLTQIKHDHELVIGKITIIELLNAGLEIDDDFEILESFQGIDIPIVNNDLFHYICVCRSNGSYTNLEINFGLFSREDSNENVHTVQEVSLAISENKLQFYCPLDDNDWMKCAELYLRADYPLVGSAKSLNIG
jgi:hypothetical protein